MCVLPELNCHEWVNYEFFHFHSSAGQANNRVKNMEKANQLSIIKLSDANYVRIDGEQHPVWQARAVENVGEAGSTPRVHPPQADVQSLWCHCKFVNTLLLSIIVFESLSSKKLQ